MKSHKICVDCMFSSFYFPVAADGVAVDSELCSVGLLFTSSAPDHLIPAPRGEYYPAQSTHPGDSSKGGCVFVFTQQKICICKFRSL